MGGEGGVMGGDGKREVAREGEGKEKRREGMEGKEKREGKGKDRSVPANKNLRLHSCV